MRGEASVGRLSKGKANAGKLCVVSVGRLSGHDEG